MCTYTHILYIYIYTHIIHIHVYIYLCHVLCKNLYIFYSALFNNILCCSSLFYSVLLYSIQFCSVLVYINTCTNTNTKTQTWTYLSMCAILLIIADKRANSEPERLSPGSDHPNKGAQWTLSTQCGVAAT